MAEYYKLQKQIINYCLIIIFIITKVVLQNYQNLLIFTIGMSFEIINLKKIKMKTDLNY